jgi:hypothetical protein
MADFIAVEVRLFLFAQYILRNFNQGVPLSSTTEEGNWKREYIHVSNAGHVRFISVTLN